MVILHSFSIYTKELHKNKMAAKKKKPAPFTTNASFAGSIFWARLVRPNGSCFPSQRKAVAFQVTPAIANIDGLKDAVKVKMMLTTPAPHLRVFAHNPATCIWVELTQMSAPITPNTEDTAYRVRY